jgi:pimeloyl-ACP methyl ester carboxylesterase
MREIELSADHAGSHRHRALVAWASRDRVMPPEHGRRLAKLLPRGRLVEADDSYTLIPLDRPARFAQVIRDFTRPPPIPPLD